MLLLLSFILVQNSFSQTVLNDIFKVTEKKGVYSYDMADSLKIDYVKLSDEYKSLWDDTANEKNNNMFGNKLEINQVFQSKAEKEEKISSEWNLLLQSLGKYLFKNDFNFDEPTSIYVKFYFDENGNIDFLFYNAKDIKLKNNSIFVDLLNEFLKHYQFDIRVGRKYSQCGSIILK